MLKFTFKRNNRIYITALYRCFLLYMYKVSAVGVRNDNNARIKDDICGVADMYILEIN